MNIDGTPGSDNSSYQTQPAVSVDVRSAVGLLGHGADWSRAVEMYIVSALDSPNTRRAYQRHLRRANEFWQGKQLNELTTADLLSLRSSIAASGHAVASKAQSLSAIRSFLTWARLHGLHGLPKEVIDSSLRIPRNSGSAKLAVLSDKEIAAMFAVCTCHRDKAMLAIMLGAGLRVAEVSALDVSDLAEDQNGELVIRVRSGKGHKNRTVPVNEEVRAFIEDYMEETQRFLGQGGPLLLARDNGAASRASQRLTARSIAKRIRTLSLRAGIRMKVISPHVLRHTFATRCLREGGNVLIVSKLLGHASISVTQRYVDHIETTEMRSSIPRLPLGRKLVERP